MHRCRWFVLALLLCAASLPIRAADDKANPGNVCDHVRYFPAPGKAKAMVGGKFTGSNISATKGFELLAEIKAAPADGEWAELSFDNGRVYRWLRYEAPPDSHGNVAEIEFYAGKKKLNGEKFGSPGERNGRSWQRALDGDAKTWFDSDGADGQYVGLDLLDQATAKKPNMEPGPGDYKEALTVTLKCGTPGALIRYSTDGSVPGPNDGTLYAGPIRIEKTTTFVAVALKDGEAVSPPSFGTYLVGPAKGFHTLHVGNSLTNTTGRFAMYARTAGRAHEYTSFTMGGAWTNKLWNAGQDQQKEQWEKAFNHFAQIDHFTLQPRDFDIAEEADYDARFFNAVRAKSPEFQPWLYVEWVERARQRPTDKGTVPSAQMKKLFPAETWEESMSAMLLYGEDLQLKLTEIYKEGKRPKIIPAALAMGWVRNQIDQGKFPGAEPGSFYPFLFSDSVHPNLNGAYLVDLVWYSALYQESPEGKVLPIGTSLTPDQATAMQRLAWDVVKNYPDCGLFEDGNRPVASPTFKPSAAALDGITPVTLSSTTPGAWFRYTLDGTTPTRTRGYVYCGVVSARPGMTVKAIAFKSGMADSKVAEAEYAEVKGK
jgi:hypothetical protein